CSTCHGAVIDQNLSFINAALHINGAVDVDTMTCSSCHGSGANSAPPTDVSGNTAIAEVTVGAHQSHLGSSTWHKEIQCSECHIVPATINAAGHIDASPAEITWSTLSRSDGAAPSFSRATATCSGSYCHGATLIAGGTTTRPVWTTVNGTQASCGTCHGLPPQAPHSVSTPSECADCHGMVVDQALNFVNAALHINGTVEASDLACNSCHGSGDNSAPPTDVSGNSAVARVTVGAHQAHLGSSTWHKEIQCNECHVVPVTVDAVGHIDASPAEVRWSTLSRSDGAAPSFSRATATCSGVYCHGATMTPGGTETTPVWTTVNGTQAACGTCHGLPPQAPHPASTPTGCSTCHGAVIDPSLDFVDPSLHVNGAVEVTGTACDSCHGNPPTVASQKYAGSGGAHVRHVTGLGYRCAVCHGHEGTGPTHDEGNGVVVRANVDIVFDPAVRFPGGTTMSNGTVPSETYTAGSPTCAVGCHNPIPGDTADLANDAVWTATAIGCNEYSPTACKGSTGSAAHVTTAGEARPLEARAPRASAPFGRCRVPTQAPVMTA
ncbi:MAG: cytochrome C family protein, partial [Acidimicrobiaceae bacterium]